CADAYQVETYLPQVGDGLTPSCRPGLLVSIANPLSALDGPRGSGHPDPDFRVEPVNTAGMLAAAPPAAGTPLATGSTTGIGRSIGAPSAPVGTASAGTTRDRSRTPSATACAAPTRVGSDGAAPPGPARRSTP